MHGSENAVWVNRGGQWIELGHRDLANFLKSQGWNGEAIRLISCSTGACPTGVAQNLANKLGVEVIAPNDKVWVWTNGAIHIGPDEFTSTGQWVKFTPGGP